jgi:hypothetical protein
MAGIIWLVGFFLIGGGLIWMTHRALVAENHRYGLTDEPPPARQERADAATDRRAA